MLLVLARKSPPERRLPPTNKAIARIITVQVPNPVLGVSFRVELTEAVLFGVGETDALGVAVAFGVAVALAVAVGFTVAAVPPPVQEQFVLAGQLSARHTPT